MASSDRLKAFDWKHVEEGLAAEGYARLPRLLTAAECASLMRLWDQPRRFRSVIDMSRHRFGVGEYRYFSDPLPRIVGSLRAGLYRRLAPVADRALARFGDTTGFPPTLEAYRALCNRAGQTKPTPLLLRYTVGGYNRLHRDLYGALRFPLQVVVALSARCVDYEGGEFLLVENHPRQQSIGYALTLEQGEGLVFFVADRAVEGARGTVRVQVRHGISRVTRGERVALGLIFHDAA